MFRSFWYFGDGRGIRGRRWILPDAGNRAAGFIFTFRQVAGENEYDRRGYERGIVRHF